MQYVPVTQRTLLEDTKRVVPVVDLEQVLKVPWNPPSKNKLVPKKKYILSGLPRL